MITVDTKEIAGRLSAVEDRGETVLICRDDKPVAELRAVDARTNCPDPLRMYPELAATILYDPTEPADNNC